MCLPFAKELVRRGHEVEVLTGFPNYPGGKVYDGYHIRPLQRENLEGIPIIRVPLYPSHDKSALRRTISYVSFALSASTIGAVAVRPADVAYICQGPATLGLPSFVLKTLRRIPFVYNIQDLWPDTLPISDMFKNPLGLKLVDIWCKFVYKCASKIVVITPGFKQKLCERGVPEDKIEVIYNCCDDSQIYHVEKDPQLASELGMAGRFNIVFAGNMGKLQALGSVLEAANIVRTRFPHVQFVFIGSGVEVDYLKQKARDLYLKNVQFLPRRPQSQIAGILSLADVLLVHLKDNPLFRITIPSKTQAYLAVGKPVLMGVRGDAADLVMKAGAGLLCEPENSQSIAEAVIKFQAMSKSQLDAMGDNGRKFYEQELSLTIVTRRFEKIFESVVK